MISDEFDSEKNHNENNDNQPERDDEDGQYIFIMSFRHHVTGKVVRRKDGKPFRIPANGRRARSGRKPRQRKPPAAP